MDADEALHTVATRVRGVGDGTVGPHLRAEQAGVVLKPRDNPLLVVDDPLVALVHGLPSNVGVEAGEGCDVPVEDSVKEGPVLARADAPATRRELEGLMYSMPFGVSETATMCTRSRKHRLVRRWPWPWRRWRG